VCVQKDNRYLKIFIIPLKFKHIYYPIFHSHVCYTMKVVKNKDQTNYSV